MQFKVLWWYFGTGLRLKDCVEFNYKTLLKALNT